MDGAIVNIGLSAVSYQHSVKIILRALIEGEETGLVLLKNGFRQGSTLRYVS